MVVISQAAETEVPGGEEVGAAVEIAIQSPGSNKQRSTGSNIPAMKHLSISPKSHFMELHIIYECDKSAMALVLLLTFSFL